jgi:hypothetical protein
LVDIFLVITMFAIGFFLGQNSIRIKTHIVEVGTPQVGMDKPVESLSSYTDPHWEELVKRKGE